MPSTDTGFVVGVIREREKGLLEKDEYIRITQASSIDASVRSLIDTPYGVYLNDDMDVDTALTATVKHLEEIKLWLQDVVADERVLQFIGARYDSLNIAASLLYYFEGSEACECSPLGSIPVAILQDAIWHNVGWELIPQFWSEAIQALLTSRPSAGEVLHIVAGKYYEWITQLAHTDMMREITAIQNEKLDLYTSRRPLTEGMEAQQVAYDWDARVLDIVRAQKYVPEGYDPIIAFWITKEMEVLNIRLILSAKSNGLAEQDVQALIRPRV